MAWFARTALVLHNDQRTQVITDEREAEVGRSLRVPMDALSSGTQEHANALRRYAEAMRACRNRPDGFWVASSDPAAADEAITGTVPISDLRAVILLSDGASRLVDRFQLATWPQLAKLVATEGPHALIDRVRDAELTDPIGRRWPRGKAHDDATAACLVL